MLACQRPHLLKWSNRLNQIIKPGANYLHSPHNTSLTTIQLPAHRSRAKNMMLYGYIGGKEFFVNSQRHLERRIVLECDGKPVQLPTRLQGLVFLNIPSYMAGTNFWGTEKGKEKEVGRDQERQREWGGRQGGRGSNFTN